MSIHQSITETIGNTPLVELKGFEQATEVPAHIIGKVESFNPAGSVKDRIALAMIDEAEAKGLIQPGATIIEPTSGNTGVALAAIAAARGYKMVLTMPETMSIERRKLAAAYGAQIVLTEGAKGMKGAIAKADELQAQTPNSIIPGQFVNPANPAKHYATTGPEIWHDSEGAVDVVVGGVGTGGTISGVGKYLKEQKPSVKVVAVEPAGSPVLTTGQTGTHKIQGIGAGFKPDTLDLDVVDEILPISDEDSFKYGALLPRTDGILVGISSGAALAAAVELAKRPEFKDANIVVILPDTGERYLSTALYD
jgi:cysteine synthase A